MYSSLGFNAVLTTTEAAKPSQRRINNATLHSALDHLIYPFADFISTSVILRDVITNNTVMYSVSNDDLPSLRSIYTRLHTDSDFVLLKATAAGSNNRANIVVPAEPAGRGWRPQQHRNNSVDINSPSLSKTHIGSWSDSPAHRYCYKFALAVIPQNHDKFSMVQMLLLLSCYCLTTTIMTKQ